MPRLSRAASALLLLLSDALAPGVAVAQGPRETIVRHVDRFTTEDGLAENNVRTVVQDRTGFIWILSRGGVLQRYDGHSFVDYRLLDSALFAGRSQDVAALVLDDDGTPWATMAGLLFRIGPAHRADTRITLDQSVSAWTTDGRGILWIVDDGTLKSIDTREKSPVAKQVSERGSVSASAMGSASSGVLWLAANTAKGTFATRLNVASARVDSFVVSGIGDPIGVRQDSAGRAWLSGTRGLAVLEPGSAQFQRFPGLAGKATTPPAPDENGGWLVATDDALARLGPDGRVSEWFRSSEVFGRSVLPTAIFVDREAGIWLSTATAGLVRLHTARSAFDNYSSRSRPPLPLASNFVMALRELRDGTLWIGTLRGGAYRVSPDWQQTSQIRTVPELAAPGNDVWDFEEADDGSLWIGTGSSICRILKSTTRCHELDDGAPDIEKDASGWFWLARFEHGLISFDPRRERFGEPSPQLRPGERVTGLFAERDSGWMWVGGGFDILRVRVNAGAIGAVERFPTPLGPNDLTYDFHRDRRGDLFAGTGAGLLRFNAEDRRFDFAAPPQLRSSTIFSIAEDSSGRLWLGSDHGLILYAPERQYVRFYNRRDNFLSGELNRRAALTRHSGTMLFGGIEGLTAFDPDLVSGARGNPPVVVTGWSRLTPNGKVDESLVGSSTLRLRPTDRAFTIQFATLSYAPDPARRYRYRIDGLNAAWVESSDHLATYSAPPPGTYTIELQASTGGGGAWSSPGTSMKLVVIPPFWMTSWFRLALLAMTALLIWILHRWRLRQALVTERLRLRISRDLHDEIGAGLSSIALLSDRGTVENGSGGTDRQVLRHIGESARAMVADLRDIVWAIDPEADRVSDVVARMKDVAASLLHDVKITYHLPPADASRHIDMAVRRDLLLLYKEMLHNVAKHAQATEVHITLRVSRGSIELTVTDNGVGFSPNGSPVGTGLKSLRERADRLGGELRLESAPGRGTTLQFIHRET